MSYNFLNTILFTQHQQNVLEVNRYFNWINVRILQTIKGRKATWIGHIHRSSHILHWNRLLKHIIEEKKGRRIEETARRGRRTKHLLDDVLRKKMILEIERASGRSRSL
jgi:hypothetical protein